MTEFSMYCCGDDPTCCYQIKISSELNEFCGAEIELIDELGNPFQNPCTGCDVLPPGWAYVQDQDGKFQLAYTGSDPNGRIAPGLPPKIFRFCIPAYERHRYTYRICGKGCIIDPESGRYRPSGECHCQDEGVVDIGCRSSVATPISNRYFTVGAPFPNPAVGGSELPVNFKDAGELQVEIVTLEGKIEQTLSSNVSNGQHSIQLQTDGLANGVYLVRLTFKGTHQTRQIHVQH